MWIGNLFLIILNLPLIGMWVKLMTIPYHSAVSRDSRLCLHRCLQLEFNSTFDLYLMAGVRRARLRLFETRFRARAYAAWVHTWSSDGGASSAGYDDFARRSGLCARPISADTCSPSPSSPCARCSSPHSVQRLEKRRLRNRRRFWRRRSDALGVDEQDALGRSWELHAITRTSDILGPVRCSTGRVSIDSRLSSTPTACWSARCCIIRMC